MLIFSIINPLLYKNENQAIRRATFHMANPYLPPTSQLGFVKEEGCT